MSSVSLYLCSTVVFETEFFIEVGAHPFSQHVWPEGSGILLFLPLHGQDYRYTYHLVQDYRYTHHPLQDHRYTITLSRITGTRITLSRITGTCITLSRITGTHITLSRITGTDITLSRITGTRITPSSISCGCQGSNSGPQACMASTYQLIHFPFPRS